MRLIFPFLFLGIFYIFGYIYLTQKEKNVLLPVAPIMGYSILRFSIVPILGILLFQNDLLISHATNISLCLLFSLEFLIIILVFRIKTTILEKPFFYLLDILNLEKIGTRSNKQLERILITVSILFLIILIFKSNLIWLYNPRTGYQYYREGNGSFYILYVSFFMLAFNYKLYVNRYELFHSKKRLFVWLIPFLLLGYFSGSKGLIIYIFLTLLICYNEYFYRLKLKHFVFIGIFGFLILAILMFLQGTSSSFIEVLKYFDFYTNTVLFYEQVLPNYSHTYGEIWLSSFYRYVPRAFFPEKPYVYGATIINEILWPGLTSRGHTPAFSSLVVPLMEFGIVGLIVYSFFNAFFIKLGYRYFQKRKHFWSYLVYIMSYYPIFWIAGGVGNYLFWFVIIFLRLFQKETAKAIN